MHYNASPFAEKLKATKPQASEYILARVFNNFTAAHIEIVRNEICGHFFGALVESKVKKKNILTTKNLGCRM